MFLQVSVCIQWCSPNQGRIITCVLFPVSASVCPLLDTPVNGQVFSNGQTLGSKATYTCHSGFRLKGPAVRFCQLVEGPATSEQKLMWTGPQPTCHGRMKLKGFFSLLTLLLDMSTFFLALTVIVYVYIYSVCHTIFSFFGSYCGVLCLPCYLSLCVFWFFSELFLWNNNDMVTVVTHRFITLHLYGTVAIRETDLKALNKKR